MQSLRGQLLVAPPHLADPNFAKSVVLILEHNDQGAFGLVLNQPTERRFADVWHEARGQVTGRPERIQRGGPVPSDLMVLHGEPDAADPEVLDGVHCCTRVESLDRLLTETRAPMRFFAGYSGWAGGQLEAELQTGSWLTAPAARDHVFHEACEDLWRVVYRDILDETTMRLQVPPEELDPPAGLN